MMVSLREMLLHSSAISTDQDNNVPHAFPGWHHKSHDYWVGNVAGRSSLWSKCSVAKKVRKLSTDLLRPIVLNLDHSNSCRNVRNSVLNRKVVGIN